MLALQQDLSTIEIQDEDRIVNTVSSLTEVAAYLKVSTQEEMANATDVVKLIKSRWKEIEGERTALVKPLNDTVGRINSRFKTILAPLAEAETTVKGRMLAFQREEARKAEEARKEAERKAEEERARLAAEVASLDRPEIPLPPEPAPAPAITETPKTTYGSFGGVSTVKKSWAFELADIAALAAARPDLLMVDAVKVNAEIRGKGGDIPGLRIFERETISVR